MNYSIDLPVNITKKITKLTKKNPILKEKLRKQFEKLMENPKEYGKSLTEKLFGYYSIRLKPMRIIYSIDENNKKVKIFAIGKRDHIYELALYLLRQNKKI